MVAVWRFGCSVGFIIWLIPYINITPAKFHEVVSSAFPCGKPTNNVCSWKGMVGYFSAFAVWFNIGIRISQGSGIQYMYYFCDRDTGSDGCVSSFCFHCISAWPLHQYFRCPLKLKGKQEGRDSQFKKQNKRRFSRKCDQGKTMKCKTTLQWDQEGCIEYLIITWYSAKIKLPPHCV